MTVGIIKTDFVQPTWLVFTCNSHISNQIEMFHLRDVSRCEGHVRWAVLDCSDVTVQEFCRSVM